MDKKEFDFPDLEVNLTPIRIELNELFIDLEPLEELSLPDIPIDLDSIKLDSFDNLINFKSGIDLDNFELDLKNFDNLEIDLSNFDKLGE